MVSDSTIILARLALKARAEELRHARDLAIAQLGVMHADSLRLAREAAAHDEAVAELSGMLRRAA